MGDVERRAEEASKTPTEAGGGGGGCRIPWLGTKRALWIRNGHVSILQISSWCPRRQRGPRRRVNGAIVGVAQLTAGIETSDRQHRQAFAALNTQPYWQLW